MSKRDPARWRREACRAPERVQPNNASTKRRVIFLSRDASSRPAANHHCMNRPFPALLCPSLASRTHLRHSILRLVLPRRSVALPTVPGPYRSLNRGKMLAGPLLARSQSHFSQSSVPEYVEDSEPEREERRTKEKSRRKKKRPEVNIPSSEVIELTDSDASYHAGRLQPISPKAQKGPIIVIDISGMFLTFALSRLTELLYSGHSRQQ